MPIAAHPHPERRAKMSLDPADASGCRESGDTKETPAENYSFTTMTSHLCQGAFAGQLMEFGKTSEDVVITVSTLSDVMETSDGNFSSPTMTTHTPWKLFI